MQRTIVTVHRGEDSFSFKTADVIAGGPLTVPDLGAVVRPDGGAAGADADRRGSQQSAEAQDKQNAGSKVESGNETLRHDALFLKHAEHSLGNQKSASDVDGGE